MFEPLGTMASLGGPRSPKGPSTKTEGIYPNHVIAIPDIETSNTPPRGSRYQIITDLGPKSHNNHGLEALIP